MFKRTHFFAKPRIQLKYVFITILLVVVTAAVSMMVMNHIIYNSSILDGVPDRAAQLLIEEVRGGVAVVSVFILIMAFIQATLFFHRLIGPLVAIEKTLDVMNEGYFGGTLKLRAGDEMRDVAEKIETLGRNISSAANDARKKITELKEKIKSLNIPAGEAAGICGKLDNLMPFFKEHFGQANTPS